MIKSMTAYARSAKTTGTLTVIVEIRAYNSRHLDTALRIAHPYLPLEDKIKTLITERIERGRIEATIHIKDELEAAQGFEVNLALAKAYRDALDRLKSILDDHDAVTLSHLIGVGGVIKPVEVERDMEKYWETVRECLIEALVELDRMRQREGKFLSEDFYRRLDDIEARLDNVEKCTNTLSHHYKKKLEARITELTEGRFDIDPNRIAQEAAILADRSDISEEIVRSRSHIEQFRAIMEADAPGGRKLNFLIQEFNREFNTMGSKTAQASASHLIVELKSELEKLREQIQNIE